MEGERSRGAVCACFTGAIVVAKGEAKQTRLLLGDLFDDLRRIAPYTGGAHLPAPSQHGDDDGGDDDDGSGDDEHPKSESSPHGTSAALSNQQHARQGNSGKARHEGLLAIPVRLNAGEHREEALADADLPANVHVVHDANLPASKKMKAVSTAPQARLHASLQKLLKEHCHPRAADSTECLAPAQCQVLPESSNARSEDEASAQQAQRGDEGAMGDEASAMASVPRKWEEHGDLILFPSSAFDHPVWASIGMDAVCDAVLAALPRFSRVALQERVSQHPMRKPQAKLLRGDSGLVRHTDNGITYAYDVTSLMFSRGNVSEKLRVAQFRCEDEVVVDMYAGIGYFTLPYLVHARAKHLYACEWNPDAVEMLKKNLASAKVDPSRYDVHLGDNALFAHSDVAQRINLGLIPTSEGGWPTAARILDKRHGGWLHVHENVTYTKEDGRDVAYEQMQGHMESSFKRLLTDLCGKGAVWNVRVRHIERVKSYAPFIDHLVYDIECRPQ